MMDSVVDPEDEPDKSEIDNYKYEIKAMEQTDTEFANSLAQHVTLDGASKTEYFTEQEKLEQNTDKATRHLMDKIDSMDPALAQEMSSEFMNVQKAQAQINVLEAKVAREKVGFDHV